jgi:Mrp family chromosome partitioning ATPase
MSGKGGVGKSTVAANLAASLAFAGRPVGLLDVDIHGPSIPRLMGLEGHHIPMHDSELLPLEIGENLKVMSIGFLLPSAADAVIWRGPMKYGVIRQFLSDVAWGELDYLVIDAPPGTGDEPLSVAQLIGQPAGAVLVTTPQQLSVADFRRSVSFCQQLSLPVLGIVENMSGLVCPHCGGSIDVFKTGGGEALTHEMGVPLLGRLPIEPKIVQCGDDGVAFVRRFSETAAATAFAEIVVRLQAATAAAVTASGPPLPSL